MINRIRIAAFIAIFIPSMIAAEIIDHGNFLTDTETQLDWLDVTLSVDRSYNDVSSQFDKGGDFSGWRFASIDEIKTLVRHYTEIFGTRHTNRINKSADTFLPDTLTGLIKMLGVPDPRNNPDRTFGMAKANNPYLSIPGFILTADKTDYDEAFEVSLPARIKNSHSSIYGSFLVRQRSKN